MAPGFDLLSQGYMARLCFESVVFTAENSHFVSDFVYHSFVLLIRNFEHQLISATQLIHRKFVLSKPLNLVIISSNKGKT